MGAFQARTLLRAISGEYIAYDNNACGRAAEGSNERMAAESVVGQGYILSPNPNNGHMTLLQSLRDEAPVHITVYNALGTVVYNNTKLFQSKAAEVALDNISSGMYYMVLRDNAGDTYTLKFVKQ